MGLRKIMLDCDGVLFDFTRHAAVQHGRLDRLSDYPKGEWNIDRVMGVDPSLFWAKINYVTFWRGIPPYIGAVDFLAWLYTLSISSRIALEFCTKASADVGAFAEGRYNAIVDICKVADIPVLPIHICIGASKSTYAAPDRLLIDDNDLNVLDFDSYGGKSILVPMIYNSAARRGVPGCTIGLDPDYVWLKQRITELVIGDR